MILGSLVARKVGYADYNCFIGNKKSLQSYVFLQYFHTFNYITFTF